MDEIIEYGLHEYVDELQTKMNQIASGIHDTFFAFKAPPAAKKSAKAAPIP